MNTTDKLQTTIEQMVQSAKGILAADDSLPTTTKHFMPIDVECTEESRRAYRALLLATPWKSDL